MLVRVLFPKSLVRERFRNVVLAAELCPHGRVPPAAPDSVPCRPSLQAQEDRFDASGQGNSGVSGVLIRRGLRPPGHGQVQFLLSAE